MSKTEQIASRTRRTRLRTAVVLVCLLAACSDSPTRPGGPLPNGRWTGDACLSVAADGCDLVVGCGHGQFPLPVLRDDGTFDVSGTYRVEVGPISINPAPPAMFSGSLHGTTLTLHVAPTDPSSQPATYLLHLTDGSGRCSVPCL